VAGAFGGLDGLYGFFEKGRVKYDVSIMCFCLCCFSYYAIVKACARVAQSMCRCQGIWRMRLRGERLRRFRIVEWFLRRVGNGV
jgi:hypothetical protein